ncbi:MAG: hypothetical protein GY715_20480, partial [Planctomycetes bacterium]|nr:hypothetical protein [Planctomycetota bacterium]
TCGDADCPQPVGACCPPSGFCIEFTEDDCAAAGGTYQGDNTSCPDVNCPPPTGACCFDDGSCTLEVATGCAMAGGTYQGNGVTCAMADCPQPGACCFDDGSCTFVLDPACIAAGGTFQGEGIDCVTADCPQPGACCFDDGSCTFVLDTDCTAGGGTYQGDGVTCAAADCPQPGACCLSDGSCTFGFATDCAASGGTYQGDGVTCAAASCPQPGACCLSDGSCTFGFATDCAASGGTYQGDGVTCAAANCTQPGACCLADGSCTFGFASDCAASGGTYQGDGVTCAAANCPQPGACCLNDGSCIFVLLDDCTAASGTFAGESVACAVANCSAPGACCFDDGSCTFEMAADCAAAGGTFQGEGIDCASANCPQPGACCLDGGACTDGLPADCAASGGVYQGAGTTCAGTTCPSLINDFCSSPLPLDCNSTTIIDNTLATPAQNDGGPGDPDLPAGSPSCQWNNVPTDAHNTLWYTFVAGDTSVEIQTCATATNVDTIIALYDGSCGSLVELACGEDECGDTSDYRSRICYDGLVPGNTYTLVLGNPGGWASSSPGVITLDVTCPCPDIGPVVGACCYPDETCADLIPADCTATGGTFQGSGISCTASLCIIPVGACCFIDQTCAVLPQPDCEAASGTFQGDGIDCTPGLCDIPTGACCFDDGSCSVLTEADCGTAGGTYQGDGVSCATVNCLQSGACCFGNGTCVSVSETSCLASGGTFQGIGVLCSAVTCTVQVSITESRVATGSDDATEDNGSMSLPDQKLEMGQLDTIGLRFNGIDVPPGAQITAAWIVFRAQDSNGENTDLTVQGQDADNPSTFTSSSNDISNRSRTSESAPWIDVENWSTGQFYSSPDLTAIVQEIVDRSGWASGNSMVMLVDSDDPNGKRIADSYEESANDAPLLHIEWIGVADAQVSGSNDDAEQNSSSGSMSRTSSDLELVIDDEDDGGDLVSDTVGVRFTGLQIPQGATILDAYVQFQVDETSSGSVNFLIVGEDNNHAAAFASSGFDITSRSTTSASVAWSPPSWSSVGQAGPSQRTPRIASIIQEIVNRPGWQSGNALAIILSGSGTRTAEFYDGSTSGAPRLHVEWVIGD